MTTYPEHHILPQVDTDTPTSTPLPGTAGVSHSAGTVRHAPVCRAVHRARGGVEYDLGVVRGGRHLRNTEPMKIK